jgi:aryl sulfotransferase
MKLHDQFRQRLLSWSAHVLSWVERPSFPVCILRYEDMVESPLETFGRAARFCGLGYDVEKIASALTFSSFEKLREQERANNFNERGPTSHAFFRKGKIGSWREELTRTQAERVIEQHRAVMLRFGYLGNDGEIRFKGSAGQQEPYTDIQPFA